MKKVWSLLISVGTYFSYASDFSPETLDLVFHSLKMDENQITESFCDSIESLWVKKMGKLCESSTNSIAYNAPADEIRFSGNGKKRLVADHSTVPGIPNLY